MLSVAAIRSAHARRQQVHRRRAVDGRHAGRDELRLDRPPGGDRLAGEHGALDDERAAPRNANCGARGGAAVVGPSGW